MQRAFFFASPTLPKCFIQTDRQQQIFQKKAPGRIGGLGTAGKMRAFGHFVLVIFPLDTGLLGQCDTFYSPEDSPACRMQVNRKAM